jgi:hypothetical protein
MRERQDIEKYGEDLKGFTPAPAGKTGNKSHFLKKHKKSLAKIQDFFQTSGLVCDYL